MVSNRNALKKYAPQARLDFIQAMTNRAAMFGITKSGVVDGAIQGDLFILNGKAFPRSVGAQCGRLAQRIKRDGFDQVMEAIAYTWFNRFLAIRYMEVHDYFDHGLRVLSHPAGHAEPQILEQVTALDLPGLNREEMVTLKLDGTKDEDIYRKVIIAQCNDLHRALPFLFERIDDETELLLPSNLLQSDSIVRKLVDEIEETEWNEIEIIGWLYQFYISEKKDQVIGKVVKSEDIPAATQLFTPNWIVKYMVQNSLGAQWLATYPDSQIRDEMEYYIAPAEQTVEVKEQIDAFTPKQLDPEAITLIDPAVGSGHILVEAYDLLRAIYLERGYTKREASRAILTKNLFGLDIDDRAAQMAGFALLMKACVDDRSVLRDPPALNVLALQDSAKADADKLANALLPQERFEIAPSGDLLPETLTQPTLAVRQSTSAEAKAIKALVMLFDGAKTFGSLIIVPDSVMKSVPLLENLLAKPLTGDLLQRQEQADAQQVLKQLLVQARLLGNRYDCVVANPPYMGGKGMNPSIKAFTQRFYLDGKSDLFSAFMSRGLSLIKDRGYSAMVTMESWMFLSSFEDFRKNIIQDNSILSMVHMPYSGKGGTSMGINFGTAAFILKNRYPESYIGTFSCIRYYETDENGVPFAFPTLNERLSYTSSIDFKKVPGFPIAYFSSTKIREIFNTGRALKTRGDTRQGMATSDNTRFLRAWFEVARDKIFFEAGSRDQAKQSGKKWFPYNKGGAYRKWSGNRDFVINWENDGSEILGYASSLYGSPTRTIKSISEYFKPSASWSKVTSGGFSMRRFDRGFIFDVAGCSIFSNVPSDLDVLVGLANSPVAISLLASISPTLNFEAGQVASLPLFDNIFDEEFSRIPKTLVGIYKNDWDSYETSWDFNSITIFDKANQAKSLSDTYELLSKQRRMTIFEAKQLEEKNNENFIRAYGLEHELISEVALAQITLTCNPHYRYGGELTDDEREYRLTSDTMRELISYSIGCIMGRYSLAEPGLIYAHAGTVEFDPSRYGKFPADDDGIIPMTEEQWFADDAGTRIEEFLEVSWPAAPVMETLRTLMDGLTMGKADEPRTALRTYLSKQFYKDHLQTYKNRPIYWLFSSGKLKAFEALVYLHRYNEGTLARMRTNYVSPLMGKLQQRMSDLDSDIASSASSAEKVRKAKEKDKLGKQLIELRAFDEELRHLADQRIALDLDDGVKVNYGRFGNLLAAKDKVCGKDE